MADTAEAEEAKLEPKVDLTEVGPCKLKLTIEVAREKVREKIEEKYKELNDSMALPGFRKGHAPRHLLERKFGKQILDEVKFNLLTKSYEEAKESKNLEPLGEPDIDPEKIGIKEGEPFTYEMTVEVRPQLNLKPYTGMAVKKVTSTVTEADLETQLKGLQESRAEWVPAEDGVAQANDQVVADFELLSEGKTLDKSENNALVLNSDISFYGITLKDYHQAFTGKKVGDRVEYPLTLPEHWREKDQAGKAATIVSTVKSVKRRRLPPLDDAFAKQYDMDSLDELKDHWRKQLAREKEKESQSSMAQHVVETVLKENEFPLPEGLIKTSMEEVIRRLEAQLLMAGKSEQEAHSEAEKSLAESREGVTRSLRERFVLEHIAQKEKIFVTEDQVEERIQRLASQIGKWPHEMRAYLEEHGLMSQLRRNMREDAVREFLLSKAKVED